MKKIYIISTYTGTVLSSIIKRISRKPYSHISIALDESLNTMYSFGRLNPRNPLFAGFVEEGIDKGLYEIRKNTICRVYSMEVSEESFKSLHENIEDIADRRNLYRYDVLSLITIPLGIQRNPEYGYVCSSFVADVLSKSGINILDKEHFFVQPNDFFDLPGLTLEYEGLLSKYSGRFENSFELAFA